MTYNEFRDRMDRFWESANHEALELKDPSRALDRLHALYHKFDVPEREFADRVLAEWLGSAEEAKRFDAVALIRAFRIERAIPALEQLAHELCRSGDPGAPFEREKVRNLVANLASD